MIRKHDSSARVGTDKASSSMPDDRSVTRRGVLTAGLACGFWPGTSLLVAGDAPARSRTLVLLHLSGGNDGLNTIIPVTDPLYREMRPRLSEAARDAIAIDAKMAFHPALRGLARLYDQGRMAIVQGVGCAVPDYSHRGSCLAWSRGEVSSGERSTRDPSTGELWAAGADPPASRPWWDACVEPISRAVAPPVVAVGGWPAAELVSPRFVRLAGGVQARTAGNPCEYKPGAIERTLDGVVRVLRAPGPPQLVLATVGGFDTHTDQLVQHDRVLRELDNALGAFQQEVEATGLAGRVLLAAWSEFGRRIAENAIGGTDHGSAGPVFLLGDAVRGGLYGQTPSLERTDFGNLVATASVGSVFEMLADWVFPGGGGFEGGALESERATARRTGGGPGEEVLG